MAGQPGRIPNVPDQRDRIPSLTNLRYGDYDDPPASDSDPPYPNRHSRLRRALRNTIGLPYDVPTGYYRDSEGQRDRMRSPPSRRRRRSASPTDEDQSSRIEDRPAGRRWTYKRQRHDPAEAMVPTFPINYGYKGQVVPGHLKMHIVSCDGGEHTDPRAPSIYLGPENALCTDQSVYCSTRDSVNLLLRHADDNPFSLEKLIVIAPKHGFTAPVTGFRVVIGMHYKDIRPHIPPPLHARLAPSNSRHSAQHYPGDYSDSSSERLSLMEALNDDEIQGRLAGRQLGSDSSEPPSQRADPRRASTESVKRDPNVLHWNTDTDDEIDSEDHTSQDVLDFRLQRMQQRSRNGWPHRRDYRYWSEHNSGRSSTSARPRPVYLLPSDSLGVNPRDIYSHDEHASARNRGGARDVSTQTMPHESDSKIAPNENVSIAEFTFKPGKHKAAVKLDPTVAGRFILLTLWSNKPDATNVDVQSIIPMGYAGPRFFPSVERR